MLCEFLKFPNRRGYMHDGMLFPGNGSGIGVIYVHGSLQNFYSAPFIPVLAKAYQASGITFLTFNLTCHDAIAEGEFADGHVEYVGGSLSPFETSRDDIDAAVSLLARQCSRVILQGHSLGCDRVVDYLLKHVNRDLDAILLSPCDSYRLQQLYLGHISPEDQTSLLEQQHPADVLELLPSSAYGVAQGGTWSYPIPVTRQALLSITKGPPFKLFNLEHPIQYCVPNRTLAVVGEQDALTAVGCAPMIKHLTQRFPNLTTAIDAESDHSFTRREAWLASRLVEWILARDS